MSRYDGLIIPRSYSDYINKTDAATLLQALQLSGVMDAAPTADSVHPVKSGGIYTAIEAKSPVVKYKEIRLDNLTIGNGGYIDIQNIFPSGMNNFMFCLLMNFGTNFGYHSFDVNADGRFMRGTPGDNIDYVILRYYYTD